MVTCLVLRARLVNGHKSHWFFAVLDAIQDGKPCAWDCDTFGDVWNIAKHPLIDLIHFRGSAWLFSVLPKKNL